MESDTSYGCRVRLAVGIIVATLAITGCGGSGDDDEREPAPFTEEAARQALRDFYTASQPEEICGFLLRDAERQLVGAAREEHGIKSRDCETVVENEVRQYEGGPERLSRVIQEERDELTQDASLDEKQQTAAFLDEFRQGTVMRLVDGRWRVARFATGG